MKVFSFDFNNETTNKTNVRTLTVAASIRQVDELVNSTEFHNYICESEEKFNAVHDTSFSDVLYMLYGLTTYEVEDDETEIAIMKGFEEFFKSMGFRVGEHKVKQFDTDELDYCTLDDYLANL